MLPLIGRVLLLGIVATAAMDILSTFAHRAHITAPLPPTLIGRWAAYVLRGQPRLANIEQSAPVSHELAIALLAHYVVGIAFAALYLYAALCVGVSPRSATPAVTFGLVTSVFPWLLMFPAMGYGWFGMRGPAQASLFLSSLISHAAFGIGLWLGARASGVS
jgi:Protein of unknown function (DUF2938)